VIIVLDTSISVGWSDFAHIRSFLSTLTDHVVDNLNVDSGRIPVGLLTYSSTVRPLFNLSLHTTIAPIQAAISSFSYSRGATNTAAALAYVRTTMLTSLAGARDDVPSVVIVLTDGKSSDPRATRVYTGCVIHVSIHIISAGASLNEAPQLQQLALNFLATFFTRYLNNNRHTISVVFYSCSFHLHESFT